MDVLTFLSTMNIEVCPELKAKLEEEQVKSIEELLLMEDDDLTLLGFKLGPRKLLLQHSKESNEAPIHVAAKNYRKYFQVYITKRTIHIIVLTLPPVLVTHIVCCKEVNERKRKQTKVWSPNQQLV